MCGRYSIIAPPEELMRRFHVKSIDGDMLQSYNAAPSQNLPLITNEAPDGIVHYKWGLIPFWAKDAKIGYKMINARRETLTEKEAFKYALNNRRCLVLADSYYEWQKPSGGGRKVSTPYRILMKNGEPFAFAGMWESWTDSEDNMIRSFTIITTDTNELSAKFHNRMPCILRKEDEHEWLDTSLPTEKVLELLKAYPVEEMRAYEVSTLVNSPNNNVPEVIKEVKGKT